MRDAGKALRAPATYSLKRISFFTRVLDLQVMTDLNDIYPSGWSQQWN